MGNIKEKLLAQLDSLVEQAKKEGFYSDVEQLELGFKEAVGIINSHIFDDKLYPVISIDHFGEITFSYKSPVGYIDIGVRGEKELSYHIRNDVNPRETRYGDCKWDDDYSIPIEVLSAIQIFKGENFMKKLIIPTENTNLDPIMKDWDENLKPALERCFEEPPEEGGFYRPGHPGKKLLYNEINSHMKGEILHWILRTISNDSDSPFSLSLIRSIDSYKPGDSIWRGQIIKAGLTSSNVETRDITTQVAENWGDMETRYILKEHQEPEPWLQKYINEVVEWLDNLHPEGSSTQYVIIKNH